MKIYLASKSPRRKELLQQMDVDFEVLLIDIPEEKQANESIEMYSQRITREKLQTAWDHIIESKLTHLPVLCADTEVILDQAVLGKPRDYEHAYSMIKSYSNRSHVVITSVGLQYGGYQKIAMNKTIVHFAPIPDTAIHHYLSTNSYQDRAGAYGIQSYIGQFIYKIEGCFYSVMGLPLHTVRELLQDYKKFVS